MTIIGPKISAGLLLLSLSGACCGASLAADRKSDKFKLPENVRAFMERRDGCDHFRGEDSPYAERRAQIDEELKRLCTGTDAELASLKRLYAENEAIQRLLAEYEVTVEPGN
ncbi:hypothetical protein FHX15_002952 [Rhizobium sp. BK650]|uniref:hypothetical protein n=1 Tax=Rhizobium sp. BK650 TaxID=2586990 RepID=UPI00161F2B5B|nr:hypothetical protein [Rhizobium sp. BK650]MBB3657710.1 hypothetical protein [Rhizobium sp. BK650]